MKTNHILRGDALQELKKLPEESISMLMTSPPYWALRDYGGNTSNVIWGGDKDCEHDFEIVERQLHSGTIDLDKTVHAAIKAGNLKTDWKTKDGFCNKCGAWKGQLGLEPTFDLYIKHLCDIFDEVKRVLRKDGTCWVNMGDTYGGSGGASGHTEDTKNLGYKTKSMGAVAGGSKTAMAKSLTCVPMRFAIEMINHGWILRNTIIWHKPNCMPSSVKDRFTVDFEYIFFFSKNKRYYFKTQYEKALHKEDPRAGFGRLHYRGKREGQKGTGQENFVKIVEERIKRAVWKISPTPFGEGICLACGYFDKPKGKTKKKGFFGGEDKQERVCKACGAKLVTSHFAIYPEELCETPIKAGCPKDGIVLDPFFGAGTTGLVALKQGKKFVGIELNKEYIKIAKARIKPFLEQTKL